MEYHEVESSNIEKVGYDEEDQLLEITFKSGGVYWYMQFREDNLSALLDAESKGKHFHKFIKGKFACAKVHLFVQDVEFESICLANARLSGKSRYLPLSYLCEKQGWDFMETWDKTLGRILWYNRQNDEYKLAVEEAIERLAQ